MANQPVKNQGENRPGQASATPAGTENQGRQGQTHTGNLTDKAREAASNVARSASDVASNVGRRVEDAAASVAGGMQSLAGTIREHAPREGTLGTASSQVAQTLESGGRYLREEGFSGMVDDLSDVIRANPIPAVLIGFGLGFLVARTTCRS
jgi:hypothetical protein